MRRFGGFATRTYVKAIPLPSNGHRRERLLHRHHRGWRRAAASVSDSVSQAAPRAAVRSLRSVEMTATLASDPRSESYRVDDGSIRLPERGNTLFDAAKMRRWQPFIAPSLKQSSCTPTTAPLTAASASSDPIPGAQSSSSGPPRTPMPRRRPGPAGAAARLPTRRPAYAAGKSLEQLHPRIAGMRSNSV